MSTKRNSTTPIRVGTAIKRYTIVAQDLHGYPPEIFLARDNNLNRELLLLFLPEKFISDQNKIDAFRRTAQSLAAVNHANLLHIYDVADFSGRPYVAMEYAGERTLFDVLREGSLSVRHGLDIAIRICAGLENLHDAAIVMHELRPDRITVGKANQVKLLTFGQIPIDGAWDEKGIGDYAAPEQAVGEKPDIRSNIFSLGLIIFEMFAGKHPFSGTGMDISRFLNEGIPSMVRGNPRIPRELHLIIEKALSRNRETRYLRIDYLREDLEIARTVNALRESEEQYRNVVERANDGICIIQNRVLKFINRRLADMVGYTVEEGINTPFVDYIHPEELPRVVTKYNLQITGVETSQRYETVLVHKDGATVAVEINAVLITHEGHRAVLAIVRDISRRKRDEQALRDSEEKFSNLFHNSHDAILIHDLEGRILDANRMALQLFGYGREEMLKLTIRNMHPPSALDESRALFQKIIRENHINFEIDFRKKNGEIFAAEVSSGILEIGGRDVVQGLIRDISQRKQDEKAIRESRRALATLMNNLAGMVYRCRNDRNWTIEFVSNGCLKLTGYEVEEVVGNAVVSYNDIIRPEDREDVWNRVQRALKDKDRFQLTYRIITKNKEEKWVWEQGCGIYSEDGELQALEGYIADITRQKEIEQHLQLLSSIVKQSNEGIALVDLEGRLMYVNKAIADMHGYSPEELLHHHLSIFHTKAQMAEVDAANKKIRETGQFNGEIWHKRRDGTVFPSYMNNTMLYDETGKAVGTVKFMRDITDRKRAEMALRESEEKYRNLVDLSPDPVVIIQDGMYKLINPAFTSLFGYTQKDVESGLDIMTLIEADKLEATKADYHQHLEAGGITKAYILNLVAKDGAVVCCEASASTIRYGGNPADLVIIRDITARKKAEQDLREAHEQLEATINALPDLLFEMDRDGYILDFRAPDPKLLYLPPKDFLGKKMVECVPPHASKVVMEAVNEALTVGQSSGGTYALETPRGLCWFEISAAVRGDIESPDSHVIVLIRDITARKEAEMDAARKSQVIEQERNMFIAGPVVIFKLIHQQGWPAEYVSPNISQVLGYSPEEIISGKVSVTDMILDEDKETFINELRAYSESGVDNFSHQPYRILRKDGAIIWIADYTTILRNKSGKITHYLGYIIDITERKLAEEMLRKRTEQLGIERKELKNKNIALNQILDHIDSQKQNYKQQVYREIEKALAPFLKKCRDQVPVKSQAAFDDFEDVIQAILAKDMDEYTQRYARLTSRESEICELIKQGMSSKQISEALNLSILTVMKHREQIRKKLEITNKSIDLATYLRSH